MLKEPRNAKGRSILFDLPAEAERRFEAERRRNGLKRAAFARMLVIEGLRKKTEKAA
jgi:hypothetical protein